MASEATVAYPGEHGFVDATAAGTFIPEIWSDEVVAAYEKNLVLAPLVKKMSMQGKKGDTIHVPKPTRGVAAAKAEGTAVTIQANLESEVTVSIDKHYEYSRLIEDVAGTQAVASLRQFYTGDAGYAMAKQVDDDLMLLATGFAAGGTVGDGTPDDWVHANSFYNDAAATAGGTTTLFAENTLVNADDYVTDTFIRNMIQKMDDADVPMDNRFLVIPPSVRNVIMGIERYVSTDFVNNKTVVNGRIGNIYGVDVYVSSNCPEIESAAENTATGGGQVRAAILAHRDTMVLAEQLGVRSQTQYKQEYLSTLYTADRLYGVQNLRPESGFVLAVPG